MALARVVTFDGVSKERADEMKREISEGQRPDEVPAVAILFFDTEEDYRRGDAALNAMPASDTPGHRTSVAKCNVVVRMTG